MSGNYSAASPYPLLAPLRVPGLNKDNWSVQQLNISPGASSRVEYAPALSRGETVTLPAPGPCEKGLPLLGVAAGEALIFVLNRMGSGND